jgi:hypothetical protein
VGDAFFSKSIKFEKGQFILTEVWDQPITDGKIGNLFYPFYDDPHNKTTSSLELQTRIQTRTYYNYARYSAKHPGGLRRLENVTQIDGGNMCFRPEASRNFLSEADLEQWLLQAYNTPRNLADLERIWLYTNFPTVVLPDFARKNFGTLAKEAEEYTNHTVGEAEWKDNKVERERQVHGLRLVFNFQRLISFLEGKRRYLV